MTLCVVLWRRHSRIRTSKFDDAESLRELKTSRNLFAHTCRRETAGEMEIAVVERKRQWGADGDGGRKMEWWPRHRLRVHRPANNDDVDDERSQDGSLATCRMLCQYVVASSATYNHSIVGSLDVTLVTSRSFRFVGCLTGVVDVGGTCTPCYREMSSFDGSSRPVCVIVSSSIIIIVVFDRHLALLACTTRRI
ncbi:hypothetical protein SCHPADRAFT_897138 [Schizopora paradoxa]|uniref:Uncharacterized protein n=1 Tax=Schizopora paradoxa TaxID=27342 RepID=A0A0H2QXG0_9AGAM|nr:hypothetical protein SCHPADRAFT_897138 [Schizopora paradoxa]